jgi:hypothetical protein
MHSHRVHLADTRAEFEDFYKAHGTDRWESSRPPTGSEDRRKLTSVLFLNAGWREADGGRSTVFAFDEASDTFTAHSLPCEADVLLLFRSDRVLYTVGVDFRRISQAA